VCLNTSSGPKLFDFCLPFSPWVSLPKVVFSSPFLILPSLVCHGPDRIPRTPRPFPPHGHPRQSIFLPIFSVQKLVAISPGIASRSPFSIFLNVVFLIFPPSTCVWIPKVFVFGSPFIPFYFCKINIVSYIGSKCDVNLPLTHTLLWLRLIMCPPPHFLCGFHI